MSRIKNKTGRYVITFIMLLIGSFVAAAALECFLIPNTILDGGITGISIIIHKLFGIPLWLLVITINIPFVYVGYRNLGKSFLIRTLFSMGCFALFLSYFELVEAFTEEILLATVFGGALYGLGVGIIIHFGGCIDGTESVAIVISKKTSFSVGQVVLFFNIIIFGVAGFLFGLDRALYSLLTYVITFKVIDFVSEGLEQAKAALIVTDKGTDLSREIYKRLGRTTTTIRGKGLISGEKEVLYCVLTRLEVYELNRIVEDMDESAFVTILDVSDIIGTHIKSTKREKELLKKKR
ncbi:MAG: YitT family protein [Bacilli bacterium]|nr:YitT family protein [Bacilli bacterium]MBR6137768.1 YitT family protein [Bacilli bacterium]